MFRTQSNNNYNNISTSNPFASNNNTENSIFNSSNITNINQNNLISSRENNSPFMIVKSNSVRMNFSNKIIHPVPNAFSAQKDHHGQYNLGGASPNFNSPNYKNYTPSPNLKEKLSDRFIPCRGTKGTNLIDRFEMAKILNNKEDDENYNEENQEVNNGINSGFGGLGGVGTTGGNQSTSQTNQTNNSSLTGGESGSSTQSNKNYTNMLKKNFFGNFGNENDILNEENSTNYLTSNNTNNNSSGFQSKLFKYKTEEKKRDYNTGSNFSFGSLLNNYKNPSAEPERKFNKIPFKILDAPGLMDDFYLNLVDWSSDNDLVVGLHNSVFIWSANKSRVQKLTEYGDDNYVSSVNWNMK